MITSKRIIEVLAEWNYWGKGLETGIERSYTNKIIEILEAKINKIVALFGVRRAGKSFILRQVAKNLSQKYGEKNVLYVNFEEINIPKDLDKIFKAYKDIVNPNRKPFLLLDEIQEVKDWEKWVRNIHEKDVAKIVVTGSSAKIMSEELSTLLAGRDISIEIFPLSFSEFLYFKNINIIDLLDFIKKKDTIIKSLREYLLFGGFPEVVLEENEELKRSILERYIETILIKDVEKRFKIRETSKLEFLATFYLSNFSSHMSYNKLSKFLKIPVKTVERFSKFLSISRCIFFLPKFSFSLKEKEISPRKVYTIDTGFCSIFSSFSENIGKLMENCVAIELLRRYKLKNIFYFKDSQLYEVDFLVKEGLRIKQLIQVTYANGFDEINPREWRALLHAYELFKSHKPELIIITWDYEDTKKLSWFGKEGTIKFIPLWKWLLNIR